MGERSVRNAEVTGSIPVVSTTGPTDGAAKAPSSFAEHRWRAGHMSLSDGIRLHWRAVGQGPPMVACNGVGVSTFFYRHLVEHYADRFTVLLWDYRGHGRSEVPSDPEHADLTIERTAADAIELMDRLDLTSPAVFVGHSMGCQVILEVALRHPERVAALVPMFGTVGRPLDTFFDLPNSRAGFDFVQRLNRMGGRSGRRWTLPLTAMPAAFRVAGWIGAIDAGRAPRRDIEAYLDHLQTMDTRVFLRMVEQIADHDLEPRLGEVTAPTLVVAGDADRFTPLHRSQAMAAAIEGAELLVLPGGSHAAIVEQPDVIHAVMDEFLARRLSPARGPRGRPRRAQGSAQSRGKRSPVAAR